MKIRPFRPEDAARLAIIFFRAVREVALGAYSRRQVEAWAPSVPAADGYRINARDGRILLVAADERDEPIAYCDLEPTGHIDHIFCIPEAVGTGVVSKLYDTLEAEARAANIDRLFVEASELAHPFFLHKGFAMLKRNDFTRRGVEMHNYDMEKRLGGKPADVANESRRRLSRG